MPREQHFTSESDSAELHRKTHGDRASMRLWMLLASLAVGAGLIAYVFAHRQAGEDVALGRETTTTKAVWRGQQINAWRIGDYQGVYRPNITFEPPSSGREWLWLGNSQMHSINQMKPGDRLAPEVASGIVGYPTFALTIPNANLQEGLATVQWALTKRKPNWIIVPVVYDDLRENDLRSEFAALLGPEWETRMAKWPVSKGLLEEVRADAHAGEHGGGATQGPTRAKEHFWILGISVQDVVEGRLDRALDRLWPVWRDREQMYVALQTWQYRARNWMLGITPQSKRAVLQVPYERNMAAFEELLTVAHGEGIKVLVYIAPLRRDVEPPYHMDQYAAWKKSVEAICAKKFAGFTDLDGIVPGELWGRADGDNIDFMHFRGEAHEILAKAIADEVRRREQIGNAREGAR